uniref:Nonstructural protein n=1 Tax=Porcine parvovirus 2 TaxID=1126383 RepID=A0A513PZV9_9VIRU|nr:MAG: nonstructural protein [Porcine parvovirus 2]QBA84566.1 MAG: nonstructural protein [Porcine parvovirus 2]
MAGLLYLGVLKLYRGDLEPVRWLQGDRMANRNMPAPEDWPIEQLCDKWGREVFRFLVSVFELIDETLQVTYDNYFRERIYHFLQMEPSSPGNPAPFHLHLAVSPPRHKGPREMGGWLKMFRQAMIEHRPGTAPPLYFEMRKTAHGRWWEGDQDFIRCYLVPKLPPGDVVWASTSMQEFDEVVLSEPKRRDYAGPLPLGDGSQDPRQGSQEEHLGPTVKGRAADRFLQAVDWLVENGCCTEAKWIEMDKMGYRSFMSTSQGVLQVKNALNLARRELVAGNKLLESIVKGADPWVPGVVNAVARLFHINGYDPEQAAWYLANWAKGGHQKRRALWLFGPANTGKTLLAGAFAKLAPCFGCVNWNNENFPFSDCASQSLIWWEEGKMSEKFVEAAKAILGGSEIRIDIKGKPSEQFIPAPVVITSNGDMCTVYSGNVISTAHAGPLKSRMLKVTFSHVLPGGPNADLPPWVLRDLPSFMAYGQKLLNERGTPPEIDQLAVAAAAAPCQVSTTAPKIERSALPPIRAERDTWDSEEEWFPDPPQNTPTRMPRERQKTRRLTEYSDSEPDVEEEPRYGAPAREALGYLFLPECISRVTRRHQPGKTLQRILRSWDARRSSVARSEAACTRARHDVDNWYYHIPCLSLIGGSVRPSNTVLRPWQAWL